MISHEANNQILVYANFTASTYTFLSKGEMKCSVLCIRYVIEKQNSKIQEKMLTIGNDTVSAPLKTPKDQILSLTMCKEISHESHETYRKGASLRH